MRIFSIMSPRCVCVSQKEAEKLLTYSFFKWKKYIFCSTLCYIFIFHNESILICKEKMVNFRGKTFALKLWLISVRTGRDFMCSSLCYRRWASWEELGELFSIGRAIPVMAMASGCCCQCTVCSPSHW